MKIISLLLEHGGDFNYCTKFTQVHRYTIDFSTFFKFELIYPIAFLKETPLHYAARSGNENILKIFIEKIGATNMPTTINRQAKVHIFLPYVAYIGNQYQFNLVLDG